MQVKRAIGKGTLHKLPIYNEYMCLFWVSTLFCMICCLFSNCIKSSTTRLGSLYITFYLREYSTFSCARTPCYAMKCSIKMGQRTFMNCLQLYCPMRKTFEKKPIHCLNIRLFKHHVFSANSTLSLCIKSTCLNAFFTRSKWELKSKWF